MSSSLAWYRRPGASYQSWDRPCCGWAIRSVLTGGVAGRADRGGWRRQMRRLESRRAPWILHWNAVLILAGRSLAWYRVPGAPPIRVGIARVADRLSVAC